MLKRLLFSAVRVTALALLLVSSGGLLGSKAHAAGLLAPSDGSLPALEIGDHKVGVVIEDGYAITTVEQTFRNPHGKDLEAIYSFPVPEKAAVSGFTYWIDGKPVSGEVLPKKEARRIYEEEKAAGNEAGLAEQDGYKTFDISVWPVVAGQDVRIRLSYIQPAHVDTGMGRYVYPLEEGGVDEEKLAFWTANEEVEGHFSFDLLLRSAYPVEALRLPGHPRAAISRTSSGDWRVHMDNGARTGHAGDGAPEIAEEEPTAVARRSHRLDTDIVVYWRHEAGLPGAVDLVAHKEAPDGSGTFMMTLTPGDDLNPITEGRDWVFVLDVSGSMRSKFAVLAEGVSRGLRQMGRKDRFRIVVFNDEARAIHSDFRAATPDNIDRTIHELGRITPDHGTDLHAGLALGLSQLDGDRSSGILLVTDGVANVGEVQNKAFLELVKNKDVRLFTLVMGNGANRPLLEAISKVSGGTAVNISNSDDIIGAVLSATSKLGHEAMHDVKIDIEGVRTADLSPANPGSLYRGQQLVLFGHYWGSGEADLTITAKVSGRPVEYETRFTFPETATRNPEIERLWAYAAIEGIVERMDIFGEDADGKQAATDLAVEAGLVTDYTSMVVVREEVFKARGIDRRNAKRIEKETRAKAARAAAPVQNRRVDQASPAFPKPRPGYARSSGSGGKTGSGSSGLVGFLVALAAGGALLVGLRRRGGTG